MEENSLYEKISTQHRPYSSTLWNGGNGNTYIGIQKSIYSQKRDEKGKLILTNDGKNVEKDWNNRNLYSPNLEDLRKLKACIDETIEKLENNEV